MTADTEQMPVELKKPTWHKIKSVDPNTKRRNLIVKVVEIKPIEGKTFAEVVVGDDSGIITCRFDEDQMSLAKVGQILRMQNSRIKMFQGHLRLECDKWSKLAFHKCDNFDVNLTNNLDATEFELVSA